MYFTRSIVFSLPPCLRGRPRISAGAQRPYRCGLSPAWQFEHLQRVCRETEKESEKCDRFHGKRPFAWRGTSAVTVEAGPHPGTERTASGIAQSVKAVRSGRLFSRFCISKSEPFPGRLRRSAGAPT